MKEGWEYSSIGDLCDKLNGLWKGKIGPFVNVGVIRNANFTKAFTLSFDNIEYLDVEAKQYKTRKLQKGDLIVEKSGGSEKQPVGRTVLFDKEEGEYSFSNFTSVLRIKDRSIISPEFLYKYILFVYLRGDTRKMQKATTGIHNIEFEKFLSIPVPQIPLSEQQSIVDYLDAAFAKIDATKANAEKALGEAKALFQASLKEMMEPKEGWEEKNMGDSEMKEGWTYRKLGEVATFARGLTYSKNDEVDSSNNVVLRSNNIDLIAGKLDFSELKYLKSDFVIPEDKRLRKGSLFICMSNGSKAHLGKVAYVDKDYGYAFGGFMGQITPRNDVNGLYLHYALSSPLYKDYIKSLSEGANINNLKYKDLAGFVIKYPSLSEQQSIVDYLDAAFAKIDAMKANAEKALGEAKALFQASLKEMMEPKEGWEEKVLKDICQVINGRAYSKDEMLKQGKYRLLRVGNFFTNDSWYYSDLELEEEKYCDKGDLLYAWSASFGPRIWDGEKVIYHYHIWKMVCSTEINKYFMCYWLDSDELKKQTMTNLHGATMVHITKGIIEAAHVSFPSLSEQQSIVAALDSLKSKVDRLQANFDKVSQECDALKQAILKQVFE